MIFFFWSNWDTAKSHINYTLQGGKVKEPHTKIKKLIQFLYSLICKEKQTLKKASDAEHLIPQNKPGSSSSRCRGNAKQLKRARKHFSFKSFVRVAARQQNRVIAAALALLLISLVHSNLSFTEVTKSAELLWKSGPTVLVKSKYFYRYLI